MLYKNLQDFIAALESKGELRRVSAEVDPVLEITQIADRMSKSGGPALLFERVKGSDFPLLINAFGSYRRMQMALNCGSFDEIGSKLESLIKIQPPESLIEKIRMLFTLKELAGLVPKKVRKAPCQEKILDSESGLLDLLPILTCWPQDGGPFVTLPIVITRDPDNGIQNMGMYRMQKYDRATTGMHWQYNKDGTRHFEKYKSRGERMDVAVALGGSPAVTYAASAPLPPDIDELVLAGFINSRPIEVVKGKTVDLLVPAESDFVIEGYVDPGEERVEGPFGDHTGFYSAADTYPVFHVRCITHRNDAVYPATVVGKPPMEDCYMAKATERIFLPLIRMLVPEMVDMELPIEGVFHNCALVSIDKKFPGQGKKIIHALWGLGQMSSTKFIAVFDKDIDLRDYRTVVWKLLNNVDPRRDLIFSEGPLDALDHSAPYPNFGGKMGIDATRKTREEGMGREWPAEIVMSADIKDLVEKRWKEYGF
ncbi:MAG: menaquinone biosynthesis decarboxylase [Dehalococcoidia bacterium]